MKLNKAQINAIVSKVVDQIEETVEKNSVKIENTKEYKAAVKDAEELDKKIKEFKNKYEDNDIIEVSIDYNDKPYVKSIKKDFSVSRKDKILMETDITLSTIIDCDLDTLIKNLVTKYSPK